jgi:hypothetical protein
MQQEIQPNIVTYTASVKEAEFDFYNVKQYDYCLKQKDDLNGVIKILVAQTNPTLIKRHFDHVYQFSKMYCKSISKEYLAITIKYPEIVAEIFP